MDPMIPMLLAGWDLVIVAGILLLLFGGSKLAGIGKSAGQAIREFKQETHDIQTQATTQPDAAAPNVQPGGVQ